MMEKPTKEELKALVERYGDAKASIDDDDNHYGVVARIAAANEAYSDLMTTLDALYAEAPTDQSAELAECRRVLGYTAHALQRTRGWASPKYAWDKVFRSFTGGAVKYSNGVATKEDRAVLGLAEAPADAE